MPHTATRRAPEDAARPYAGASHTSMNAPSLELFHGIEREYAELFTTEAKAAPAKFNPERRALMETRMRRRADRDHGPRRPGRKVLWPRDPARARRKYKLRSVVR